MPTYRITNRAVQRDVATGRETREPAGIAYPTDPGVIARLQAGEAVPIEERGIKEAPHGSIQSDIPACSVPWLLEHGAIEPVEDVDVTAIGDVEPSFLEVPLEQIQ